MQYNISEISEFIAMKNATGMSKDDKGILSSLWGWIFGGGSGGSGGGGGISSGGGSSSGSNEISVEDAESPGIPVNFPTCDCREFCVHYLHCISCRMKWRAISAVRASRGVMLCDIQNGATRD
jgi:hypothetical protein